MKQGRLSRRIFASLVGVALLAVVGAGLAAHTLLDQRLESPLTRRLMAEAAFVGRTVPTDLDRAAAQGRVDDLGDGLDLDIVLVGEDGTVIASTFDPAPAFGSRLRRARERSRWVGSTRGQALVVPLPDGRSVAVWPRGAFRGVVSLLVVFFGILAAGSAFVARRLTARLEALEAGVSRFGAGELGARVAVRGHDEIARLAERFNASADRIERLVEAQRRVLRNASHELRSPLARLRMALELIRERGAGDGRIEGAVADIAELDGLVDDILLASRMEDESASIERAPVDLAALLSEEGARAGVPVEAGPAEVTGDARLLRRLVRNLLDNAARHGGGRDVSAGTETRDVGVRLWISDGGPGVPAGDEERVFEPFYRGGTAAGHGTGLGLSLVRQIASRHGGRVTCRTRGGGGALFEVVLPPGR